MCYTAYFRHAVVESHFALVKHWGRSPQVQGCQGASEYFEYRLLHCRQLAWLREVLVIIKPIYPTFIVTGRRDANFILI